MLSPKNGERLDEINFGLRLLSRTDGLTFGTDALLLAAYLPKASKARAVELGGGTGVISLLALTLGKCDTVLSLEIQPAFAELIERNAALNGLSGRLSACCTDLRGYAADGKNAGTADLVFSNPPYMKTAGRASRTVEKNIARHEVCGDIGDFCSAAAHLLRYGGRFFCVYRPDRLTDLLTALRQEKLEPKALTFVHADRDTPPSVVLVEAVRGGRAGMQVTPPLFLYEKKGDGLRPPTAEMAALLSDGEFPYRKKTKGARYASTR